MKNELDAEGLFPPGQQACPYCAYKFDAVSIASKHEGEDPVLPEHDAINICINCLLVSRYVVRGALLSLRVCSTVEDLTDTWNSLPPPVRNFLRPYAGFTAKGLAYRTFRVEDPRIKPRANPGHYLEVFTLGRVTDS
jgi:hypothetical protein